MSEKKNSDEPTATWWLITPELARELLDRSAGNRKINRAAVTKYKRDFLAGNYRKYHPIGLDQQGRLIDGHHRLHAVIAAGIAVDFLVVEGLSEDTVRYIDQGFNRTDKHVADIEARLRGKDGELMSTMFQTTARRMMEGIDYETGKSTRTERLDFYQQHKEAVDFVLSCIPKKFRFVTQSSVLAPIARAWYTQDRDRLAQFCHVLTRGVCEGGIDDADQAAGALREYLLAAGSNGSRAFAIQVYKTTEYALKKFLAGEKATIDKRTKKRRAASEVTVEQFPLPEKGRQAA